MRGEDAVQRSLATILGRVGEELAPLIIFANYGIEPKDLRHIGSPVDYIAFKGYSSNKRVEEIIFFEIKTGKTAKLSDIEKSVRNVIASGKVRYVVINVKEGLEKLQARLVKPLRRRVGRIQQRRILTNRESGLKTAFCF